MPIFATSNHTTRLITPPPTTIQQNAATTLALTMAALCESNARCSAQSYVLPDGTSPAKAKTFMEYMQEHTSAGFASAFHSGKLKDWETHKTKFTSLANDFLEREVLLPPHQRTRNPPPPPPPLCPAVAGSMSLPSASCCYFCVAEATAPASTSPGPDVDSHGGQGAPRGQQAAGSQRRRGYLLEEAAEALLRRLA